MTENLPVRTIKSTVEGFLDSVSLARSANTARTYRNGMEIFLRVLGEHKLKPAQATVDQLTENAVAWLAAALKDHAPTTERLYLTVAAGYFEYLAAENLAPVNLPRVRLLIRQRGRRPGVRLPQFPGDDIEKVLLYADSLLSAPAGSEDEHLRALRDRAFLITLADTGLRVHEACNLRRGDVDWNEGRAVIIGKGDKQAVVRFSKRSQAAILQYFQARAHLDGATGRPLSALPLFARHGKKGGTKNVRPMTPNTGRNIVDQRVHEALGPQASRITPHSFRHYFVTRILQVSQNLKLAQELARHKNIAVTQRYAHLSDNELDEGYIQIFEDK